MLFLLNPHRIYESGLFSGSSGKMLAIGRLARHEGGGGVSCPLGLRAEEGQGAGCGFHLSFHRINREQASNLGSKEFGGFPGSPVVKNPPAGIGDVSLIPGWGRSPGEGSDNTLQHSCLENPRDRGPWWATDRGVTKSQTQLNNSRESSQLRGTHTVPDG